MKAFPWTSVRILIGVISVLFVAAAVALATEALIADRPGPALLAAIGVVAAAGATRLALFD
jgi:hypothetical protein